MFNMRVCGLVFVLLLPLNAAQAMDRASSGDESMRYLVSYRGIFSAMSWIDIADAVLRGGRLGDGDERLQELELRVSSEPHGFVESLYPFRYRARSLFRPDEQGSLVFESFKQTKKRKHDLFWLDRQKGRVVRFRPDGKNPQQASLPDDLSALVDPDRLMRCEGLGAALGTTPVFDRLSLLHRIRQLDLDQPEHLVTATDGKRRLTYRITLEKTESVEAVDRVWPAWKLEVVQVDAMDDSDAESISDHPAEQVGRSAHRPVYVWLSRDADRLPLLFENSHAIGRFTIRLTEADYRSRDVAKMSQHRKPELEEKLASTSRMSTGAKSGYRAADP